MAKSKGKLPPGLAKYMANKSSHKKSAAKGGRKSKPKK